MKILIALLMLGSSYAAVPNISNVFYDQSYGNPEQIHLSFGSASNEIVVTWSTFNNTRDTRVRYGENNFNNEVVGTQKKFTDGGRRRRSQWIHTVRLPNLKYNTTYVYIVGSVYSSSEVFRFITPPEGTNWISKVIVYGDMGSKNAHALPFLEAEVAENNYNMIMHVGDFAYDMNSKNGMVGDQFMNQIQPLAAYLPYMTCPGNHEQAYNFSHYSNRFKMPGAASSIYYSFNLGLAHYVFLSTEVYYFQQYGFDLIVHQYDWLVNDLKEANSPANRTERPWIILAGHRPMYCTNTDNDCNLNATRIGINGKYAIEPLLYKYGVDMFFFGHEHSYERTWPLYNNTVYNGSLSEPYVNYKATIHITTGSAGCDEQHDPFKPTTQPWSAYRNSDYGYGVFTIYNATHLYFEQKSVDKYVNNTATVIDKIWVVKDKHGSFNSTN